MEYLRFILCRKIYITIKAIVSDHLFSIVRDVRTHGRQSLQRIEHPWPANAVAAASPVPATAAITSMYVNFLKSSSFSNSTWYCCPKGDMRNAGAAHDRGLPQLFFTEKTGDVWITNDDQTIYKHTGRDV